MPSALFVLLELDYQFLELTVRDETVRMVPAYFNSLADEQASSKHTHTFVKKIMHLGKNPTRQCSELHMRKANHNLSGTCLSTRLSRGEA